MGKSSNNNAQYPAVGIIAILNLFVCCQLVKFALIPEYSMEFHCLLKGFKLCIHTDSMLDNMCIYI